MRPLLDKLGLVGSPGQSPVAFPCSFAVSMPATASILQSAAPGTTAAPSTPDLLVASDSGASSTDNITNDTTPAFRVGLPPQAVATDTLRVYRAGSTEIGSKVLDATDIANVFADVTASALASGPHSVTARVENGVGLSPASSGLALTVDAVQPSPPTAIVVTPAEQGSGPLQTDVLQPTFRIGLPGNAAAGDVVTLEIDTVDDATAALDAGDISAGFADIQSANALADDTLYDISAFLTDPAGNQGNSSAPVEVEVGIASGNDIPAVVYDGATMSMRHTGGLAGALDGPAFSGAWVGKFNSDGSEMTLFAQRNAAGIVLELIHTAGNVIQLNAWDAVNAKGTATPAPVFACATAATALNADGLVAIVFGCRGTHAALALVKSTGTSLGTNTPGAASALDLTSDLFIGQNGASASWLDADQSLLWGHALWMDPHDQEWRDQFWDRGANLPRVMGATAANPLGGATQPLMCHAAAAASHVTNKGSGGDADNAAAFADGASPGAYSPALVNAFDLLLAAEAWWSADHSANVVNTGAVETLANRAGTGNNATQATAASRPALVTAGGLSYMDFDGSDDQLPVASPTAGLVGNFDAGGTLSMVFKSDSDGGANFGRVIKKSNNEAMLQRGQVGNAVLYSWDMDYTGVTGVVFTADLYNLDDVLVFDIRFDKSSLDNTTQRWKINTQELTVANAGLDDTAAPTGAVESPASFVIGNNITDTERAFDGRIYEMAVWDTDRSDADMARFRLHLGRKYGVTVA